jgi:hypothetical protein
LRSAYAPLRILKVSAVDIGSIGTAFRPQPIGYPESIISQKSKPGKAHILVVPIGFVADHLKILYDIDIEAQEFARSHGQNLKRTAPLNMSPKLLLVLSIILTIGGMSNVGTAVARSAFYRPLAQLLEGILGIFFLIHIATG